MMALKIPSSIRSIPWTTVGVSTLFVAMIGVMVIAWQGGSLFGADFSWVNNSYAVEQAYDSTAFQVEEDSESDNSVTQEDTSDALSEDPSNPSEGYSGRESSLSGTVVPTDEEVVIGSGGDAQGGNPSQGQDPSGGGNDPGSFPGSDPGWIIPPDDPTWEPDRIGDPSRFEEVQNPYNDDIGAAARDVLVDVTIEGRGKVLVGQPMDVARSIRPYVDGHIEVRRSDTGRIDELPLNKVLLKEYSYTIPKAGDTETTVRLSYIDPSYGSRIVDVVCDVYDHMVTFDLPKEDGESAVRFFSGDELSVPSDIWEEVLAGLSTGSDGSLEQLFLGWISPDIPGALIVDKAAVPQGAQSVSMVAQPVLDLTTSGYSHLRIKAIGDKQTLVAITDVGTLGGSTLRIPDGVNEIGFDPGAKYPGIEAIEVPRTVRNVDVASVANAFPDLKEWSVSPDNPVYSTTMSGYLTRVVGSSGTGDPGSGSGSAGGTDRVSLESVPPAINISGGIDIEEAVVAFGKDAFISFGKDSPLYLNFESEEVRFEDWDSIPDHALISTPVNSPFDRAYCRYLSAVELHRPALQVIVPSWGLMRNGGSYEADGSGVVRFRQDDGRILLAYVPSCVSGSYDVPADISGIAATAFIDAPTLATMVLHDGMDLFEEHSLFGKGVSSIVVPEPDSISFDAGVAAFAPRSSYPDDLVIILQCEKNSEGHRRWLDELTSDWGSASQADDALVCLGDASGDIEADGETGSVYVRNGAELILCSVPSSVGRLDMKESATEVLASAFAGCDKLKVVQLPDSIKRVGKDAFAGCSSLEAVIYPDSVLEGGSLEDWKAHVGLVPTSGCASLQIVKPSSSFTSDGAAAVYERTSEGLELSYVVLDATGDLSLLPATVSIAPRAAFGRAGLASISNLSSVKEIGAEAFASCSSLRSVDGLMSVGRIGDRGFAGSGLSGALCIVGDNLVMGEEAFSGCRSLREVDVRGTVSTLGLRTFKDCDYLQKVDIGDPSTRIATTGTETFKGCSSLSSVEISGALKRIGTATFSDCESLTSVRFLDSCKTSLTNIEDDAFRNCVSLNGFSLSGLSVLESVGSRFMFVDSVSTSGKDMRASSSGLLTTRVTLPASLKSIGQSAFGNQTALQTVDISGSDSKLSVVGDGAFIGCSSLRQIDLGVSVSALVVENSAFEGCSSLQRATLPKTMTTVSERAFKDCSMLSSFVLRGSGSSAWAILGNEAFAGCALLNSMDLSSTKISLIGSSAFAGCASLTLVTLPESLTALGDRAFAGCSALATVSLLSVLPPSVGADTFEGCPIATMSVQVPQSQNDEVLSAYKQDPLWQAALEDASGSFDGSMITSTDPDMVVFDGASYRRTDNGLALVKVDATAVGASFIPMSQASIIEGGAFEGCSSLVSVKIPASIKRIEAAAFKGCSSLEILAFEADRPAAFGGSMFGADAPSPQFKLYVPSGSTNWYGSVAQLEKYRIVTGGASFAVQDDGLLFTSYNSSASAALEVLFKVPRSFTGSISLSAATDYIADGAAEGCTGIREVYLNGYCLTVGRRAFKGCTSLVHADLGPLESNNLTGLGESSFEGCSALKTLMTSGSSKVSTIPRTVTSFGSRVFKDCTSLTSVSLQGAVEKIPDGFLEGCTRLGYLTAGTNAIQSIRSFGDSCFAGCTSMTTAGASLSSFVNLRSIGSNAYAGCTNLSLVTFPATLTEIGAGAFSGCANIEAIAFNAASPISLDATGLDGALASTRVFVPLGTKSAWEQSFDQQPFVLDEVSATYRAISGNIYAETRYVSGTEGDLSFLATTKNASSSGTVSVYDRNLLQTKSVNAHALSGQSHVNVFNAGAHCEMIGDHAFDGAGSGSFTLNLSEGSVVPQIGSKIFGEAVPVDKKIRIEVQSSAAQESINALSPKLRDDYGMELQVESVDGETAYLMLVPAASNAALDTVPDTEEPMAGDASSSGSFEDGAVDDDSSDIASGDIDPADDTISENEGIAEKDEVAAVPESGIEDGDREIDDNQEE